jgi:H+-translocating NAD(P) transhydrogenase subunit alpha
MYAKNLTSLITLLTKDGGLNLDLNDDIIAAVCVTTNGEVRNASINARLTGVSR